MSYKCYRKEIIRTEPIAFDSTGWQQAMGFIYTLSLTEESK